MCILVERQCRLALFSYKANMNGHRTLAFALFGGVFLFVFALTKQETTLIQPFHNVDAVQVCTTNHLCQTKGSVNTPDAGDSISVRWCYCDDACGFFGDCCYDYEEGSAQPPGSRRRSASKLAELTPVNCTGSSDGDGLEDGDSQLRRDSGERSDDQDGDSGVGGEFDHLAEYLTTAGIPRSHFPCTFVGQRNQVPEPVYRYGFWLNSFCPANTSVNSRRLCEDPPGEDVILKTPVSGARGVAYKNVYCAICNGESLSMLEAWAVHVNLHCNSSDLSPAILDALSLRRASSTFDFQPLDAVCSFVFLPRSGTAGGRYCFPDIVTDCNSHGGSPGLCDACDSYAAVVVEPEGFPPSPRRVFRNPHCALSHGVNFTSNAVINSCRLSCPQCEQVAPLVPSMSILINFRTGTSQVDNLVLPSRCPPNFVFDPFTDRCRILSCAVGYRLEGGRCIAHEPSGIEDESNFPSTVEVLMELNIDGKLNCSKASEIGFCFAKPLLQIFNGLSAQQFALQNNLRGTEPKCRHSDSNNTSLEFTLVKENASLDRSFNIFEIDAALNGSRSHFRGCISFNKDSNLRSIVLYSCNSIVCSIRNTDKCGNVEGKQVTEMLPLQSNTSHGFVRIDSDWYSAEQTVFSWIYSWQPVNEIFDKLDVRVSVCDGEELSCAHVALNASLFRPIGGPEGSSLEYLPTRDIIAPGNFSILRNGSILVCSIFDNEIGRGIRNDLAEVLITLIGTIFSIIATVVIFVTYLAFRSLRNHIRCPLLNLTASLILANLTFLMSRIATANAAVCTAVAFLGHVSWLSVSTWSNIIAAGMYGAFSASSAVSLRGQRVTGRNLLYSYLYAYGVPCCICVPCLVMDLTYQSGDIPLFSYQSEVICFIYVPHQMLFAFVVPLLICVLVNLVLFSLTVRGIRITKNKAQIVTGQKSVTRQAMEELPIYLKISSLMGFSWLFGFLATVTKSSVLNYIFIVLTSCQGLLIFLCFANGRVRALWMAMLRALFRGCCSACGDGNTEPGRAHDPLAKVSDRAGTAGTSGDNYAGDWSASMGTTEETAL